MFQGNNIFQVLNIFGQNISEAGVDAVGIGATNSTEAELQVAAATLSGQIFDLPAGPLSFSLGAEWRYASSQFVPDGIDHDPDARGRGYGAAVTAAAMRQTGAPASLAILQASAMGRPVYERMGFRTVHAMAVFEEGGGA